MREARNHLGEARTEPTAEELIIHNNAPRAQPRGESAKLGLHSETNLHTDNSVSQNGCISKAEANALHNSLPTSIPSLIKDISNQSLTLNKSRN